LGDYAYRGEGEKGVGYEIMDQIQEQNIKIKNIVVPIGNGTLLSALWRALHEMKYAQLISVMPKIYGVQAAGCSPAYNAWIHYKKNNGVKKKSIKIIEQKPKTIATAIACGNPTDGDKAVSSVIESKGEIITVTDKEILQARRHLATTEALDCEPSGAVSYAGFRKRGLKGKTVCILTGHGLKDTKHT